MCLVHFISGVVAGMVVVGLIAFILNLFVGEVDGG